MTLKFVTHRGGKTWSAVIAKKWWKHQREALAVAGKYLGSGSRRQAMIRMPTGTGKTVVIAGLAQLLGDFERVLIVAPWESLVAQLQREVSRRVWEKLGESSSLAVRPTRTFTPATLASSLRAVRGGGVLICTTQALQGLHNDAKAFGALRNWAKLTLVDEGHREPAPKWAEAIRGLDCPTLLFTATPYRNDLQLFDVDPAYFCSFTFPEALDAHVVRDVQFIEATWPRDGKGSVGAFVTKLLKTRDLISSEHGTGTSPIRVIVRCSEAHEIRAIARELSARGESALGVHETFKKSHGPLLCRDVPDPQKETAQFWVHQNKLVEGLDDSAFQLVAIFGRFTNARNLVQQIGRVLRNPQRQLAQKAFVLSHQQDGQGDLWKRFLEYERDVLARTSRGLSELSAFDDFMAAFANAPRFYFLGDFKRQLRPQDVVDPRQIVRMRKSVLVRLPKAKFDWNKLRSSIESELLCGDAASFGSSYQDASTYLQLYQLFEQSELVKDGYMTVGLGYVFAKRIQGYVFFSDSEGRTTDYLRASTDSVDPVSLHRLLPDQKTTIKELSLISGDFGNHSFRRRVVSMDSLDQVPPALSDYVQVCSTATGSVRQDLSGVMEVSRRYLGFTKGRLSERTSPMVDFGDFEPWLTEVSKTLRDARIVGEDTLERFARPHRFDPADSPRHILFDIASEELDPSLLVREVDPNSDESLWTVKAGAFSGEIDGRAFDARLVFDSETHRFTVESADLDKVLVPGTHESLTEVLNRSQCFRILLDSGSIYAEGGFFTPNLQPWKGGGNRLNIERIVYECPDLRDATSEKGDLNGWTAGSVFGAITDENKLFSSAGWKPEVLICNDVGGPEIADFIGLCETTKRIVMIHAKHHRRGSSMSASAFHDVCSQAVRYLAFFNPTDKQTKLTSHSISGDWCPNATKHPKLKRLVWCAPIQPPSTVAKKLLAAVADPEFTKEVWIVMGNGLSKQRLSKALVKASPKPNERQMSYLLQSTWTATVSLGAALRVFCMP